MTDTPDEKYDCWQAIRNDPELDRARSKLSIHELRAIIKHAKHGMIEPSIYESAVTGRRTFRQLYRDARADLAPSAAAQPENLNNFNEKLANDTTQPAVADLAALIKPLWLAAKPSKEAQCIRSRISRDFDSPDYPKDVEPADFVPEYVWDLLDIAAQRGIDRDSGEDK